VNELELEKAEAQGRLEWTLSRSGLGICSVSARGTITSASEGISRMLGYPDESAVVGLDLAAGVYADAAEHARILALADAGEPEWMDTRWKRRDGSVLSVRLAIRRAKDAPDDDAVEILAQDVTERQRQGELVRRSERMASLGSVLAGAAHELNNPLAAILGFSQLLLRRRWPLEDRTAIEAIHHEALRSATIVKDLLALARRRGVERRAPADINELVAYIARTRRYALETAGIVCDLELGPALPPVRGDRTQLEQVVLNLLNNAEQALRPRVDARPAVVAHHGRIVIRTRREYPDVIVEVEDNGPGVPDDARSEIWDPFWTTKEDGEGTGLGLTVVHTIIVDHGGSVALERGALGGARFVIRLPTLSATEQPAAPTWRPLDVLVVDPRAEELPFVERFLASRGHAVINAATGEAALKLASQGRFDAVLCDAELSVAGMPIVDELRASAGCANARFVVSAERDPETLDPGVSYVARPYDVDELRRLIEG